MEVPPQPGMALLNALFMNAPMGVAYIDRSLRYVFVNDTLAQMHGLPAASHPGKEVREVVPRLWTALEPILRSVLSGETVLNSRMQLEDSDLANVTNHWLASFYPIKEAGEIIGIGSIANDVTSITQNEEALRLCTGIYEILSRTTQAVSKAASVEALYRDVCDVAVNVGKFTYAWIGVPNGSTIVKVASAGVDNGIMSEFSLSIDPDDPRSQGPTGRAFISGSYQVLNDFFDGSMPASFLELAERAGFNSSASFPIREGGRVSAALCVFSKFKNYFSEEMVATLSDLTPILSYALDHFAEEDARRRDEGALRLRDRAIRSISQGIVVTDALRGKNNVVYASPSFEVLSGYTVDEVMGRNCWFLEGSNTDPTTITEFNEALQRGENHSADILNYRKDGTPFWNNLSISPVTDDLGTVTNIVMIHTDVSERRELQDQLFRAQKMEVLGKLAGGIAHDFNNMLLVIRGYSAILAKQIPDEELRELAQRIDVAVQRAAEFTRRLLTFSRQQVAKPELTDLNELLLGSLHFIERVIGDDIELVADFEPELPLTLVDRDQIEQAVLNLAANARNAMPKGGTLIVHTSAVELGKGYVAVHPDVKPGPYVMVQVVDNGVGMDENIQNHVFEPFFTTKKESTGLGLATVYGIVHQNRGHLWFYSEVDVGTTFKLYFPVASSNVEDVMMQSETITSLEGDETILLVEDIEEARTLLGAALEAFGYQVVQASNGQEALDVFEKFDGQIDLLLTDIIMPFMDGEELAHQLLSRSPNLRILFTSGYPSSHLADSTEFAGRSAFVEKPYLSDEVALVVRQLLNNSSRHKNLEQDR
jgi:PAS domain S-box-containing protein